MGCGDVDHREAPVVIYMVPGLHGSWEPLCDVCVRISFRLIDGCMWLVVLSGTVGTVVEVLRMSFVASVLLHSSLG